MCEYDEKGVPCLRFQLKIHVYDDILNARGYKSKTILRKTENADIPVQLKHPYKFNHS